MTKLKCWKRSKDQGMFESNKRCSNYKHKMWVGTNNKIYLTTGNVKEVVYIGKSHKKSNRKLQKALKKSPGDILYYGV